jgi:3-isopropylmalate/(R)-2-methylmalate dehydratase large subunit
VRHPAGKRLTIKTFGGPAYQMTENAGCAACLGGPVGTFGRINKTSIKSITATNRNFPGRMGDKESQVLLASPMTVAASASAGKIVGPCEYPGN